MCWTYNPNSKYAKKFGVFKKRYKPSYNQNLYGYIEHNVLTHLKFVNNQSNENSIFCKPSLSTLLSMVWLSQQPQYRRMYYTWCCFLTKFSTIYYKPYIEYLINYQAQNKLAIFTQQAVLFKSLESYYYTTPDFEKFKSDYFFYNNYDYPYLLPYKNYLFKNEYTVYGVLWTGIERLRQKKYNEYVKAHYILHQARHAAIRARFIVKNVLYPKKKLLDTSVNYRNWHLRLWYKFFINARKKKYQLVLNTLQDTSSATHAPSIYTLNNHSLFFYYFNSKHYLNNYIWNKVTDYQKLNSRWFRSLIYVPIVWNLNKGFVNYIYQFPSQSRLDIIHSSDYIIAHGLNATVYDRLMEKQMVDIKQQTIGQFVIQDNIQDYFIVDNLSKHFSKNKKITKFISELNKDIFDSYTVNLIITNDIFNRYLLTRLFSKEIRTTPLKISAKSHFIDNIQLFEHIKNYILCGSYYKVPGYMTKVMGVMNYFYWRSYNTDAVHQAHKGRLHLHHYINKLNIELLLSQQLYNIYKIILYIWNNSKIGTSAIGLNQVWNYMSINYINWLHSFSYLTFFCLFKYSKHFETQNYYQQLCSHKPYISLRSHIMIRRYLYNYSTIFKRFRRAPYDQNRGTCIHGKNPDRLEQWLVHVNWMRIIGLSRDQLPFYLYPDQENDDYLQELIKKTAHHHIDIFNCGLFVIDNDICVHQSDIKFLKPYIKITNMLYE